MNLHILIFWDYFGPYHHARLRALERKAVNAGCSISAVELAGKSATYSWDRINNKTGIHTLFPNEVSEQISAIRVFRCLRSYLKDRRPDVIFVPSYWPSYSLAATLAAKTLGIQVVVMADSHYSSGTNTGLFLIIKRLLIKLYSAALVAGSAQRSFFTYLGMPGSRIMDGYDVVDNEYFSMHARTARLDEAASKARLQLPNRYILSLGRFVYKKNLATVLKAYALAARNGKLVGVHLLFVGSGNQKHEINQLAIQLGLTVYHKEQIGGSGASLVNLPHAVCFQPFAQINDTPTYYAHAECFVLASRTEEWGLVVNEAMACGCPVVVSRSVGCSFDLIESGETGFRFHPDNVEELAWYLDAVCSSPELQSKLAVAAYKRIAEWGPDRFAENVIAIAKISQQPKRLSASEPDEIGSFILLQTSFPDYRIPVYEGLHQALGPSFRLYTGMEYFTPDVRTCSEFRSWIVMVKNIFLWRRQFLWQGDILAEVLGAEVVILELNPRIISNWLIIFIRLLWARPTILWGHAWGREGGKSPRNLLRLLMMRGASVIITYTQSQKEQLKCVLPNTHIVAAPNSLTRRADCFADEVAADSLNAILYVGRLNAHKKPGLLLDAFIKIHRHLPDHVKLYFIGTGDEREKLEARVAEAGLGGAIKFMGHVNDPKILRDLYARAFCAVSPGYVGLSAIQSFSFGVPMIIADNENHAPEIEACREPDNTVFFSANNTDALGGALKRLWDERVEWAAKRGTISSWVGTHYSTDAMVAAFVEAINGLDSNSVNK